MGWKQFWISILVYKNLTKYLWNILWNIFTKMILASVSSQCDFIRCLCYYILALMYHKSRTTRILDGRNSQKYLLNFLMIKNYGPKIHPRVAARVGLGLMIQILHERSEFGPSNLVVLVLSWMPFNGHWNDMHCHCQ